MNVIAKISWCLERSVVMLKLRKEYLKNVTRNTPVLLRIKYWTVWYIDRYSMSTYMGVTNFQKNSPFFGPPCIASSILDNSFNKCGQVFEFVADMCLRKKYFIFRNSAYITTCTVTHVSIAPNNLVIKAQLLTLCHPCLTYIFNFWHSGTLKM